jgi:hypothetical protein
MGIETILMVAATAVSTIGALKQGQQQKVQQKAYANYQAAQANADAKAERDAAEVHADKIRKAARLQASEARAALAGSGVDVGAGTPVDINSNIYKNAEEDAWTTILGGKNKGASMDAQAQGLRISGKNAETASYFKAAGSALSGAVKIGKGWKTAAGTETAAGTKS